MNRQQQARERERARLSQDVHAAIRHACALFPHDPAERDLPLPEGLLYFRTSWGYRGTHALQQALEPEGIQCEKRRVDGDSGYILRLRIPGTRHRKNQVAVNMCHFLRSREWRMFRMVWL